MMEVESPTEPPTSHIDRGTGTLTADASRLFRVYKTISSLLSKRGYMVSREMRDMTPMDFTNRFGEFPTREGLTILVVCLLICHDFILVCSLNVSYAHFLSHIYHTQNK